jgi:hypothetical protein
VRFQDLTAVSMNVTPCSRVQIAYCFHREDDGGACTYIPHIWDTFDHVHEDPVVLKCKGCNEAERKLVEFYERTILEILKRKYGMYTKSKYTFVYQ